jgi:Rrf2 family protein
MQLPIKAHYATLAMLALASRYASGEPLQARVIARQHDIPSQFLGQILQQLRTAGVVTSTRGSSGGFRLSNAPDEISIAAIVEAVCSSGTAEFVDSGDDPLAHVVSSVWKELNDLQMRFLERLTLADLAQRLTPDPAGMFFI